MNLPTRSVRTFWISLVVGLAPVTMACSSSDASGGSDDGGTGDAASTSDASPTTDGSGSTGTPGACRTTITGAVEGGYDCRAVGGWFESSDSGAVQVVALQGGAFGGVVNLALKGKPKVGTFTQSDFAPGWVVSVQDMSSYHLWAARNEPAPQGTCTLVLTSVTVQAAASGQEAYVVHGTVDAELQPNTAGTPDGGLVTPTGTVRYKAAF